MFKDTPEGETHCYPIVRKMYAVVWEDEHGTVIHTFTKKSEQEEFYQATKQ